MISSLLRFIGGFVEAELCPLIFLGRLIFAVAAAAAAAVAAAASREGSVEGLFELIVVQHWVWVPNIFCRCLFPDLFCRWLWYPFIINLPTRT